jgi:hypothetical protein
VQVKAYVIASGVLCDTRDGGMLRVVMVYVSDPEKRGKDIAMVNRETGELPMEYHGHLSDEEWEQFKADEQTPEERAFAMKVAASLFDMTHAEWSPHSSQFRIPVKRADIERIEQARRVMDQAARELSRALGAGSMSKVVELP